jgi:hypothetical protein
MSPIEIHDPENGLDPAPAFASDVEIALADKLWRQIEERYLGSSQSHSPIRQQTPKA